jgi:hypothetical protein
MTVVAGHKLTNQEAFNEVWNWFVVEKHPKSVGEPGSRYVLGNDCKYRGPNGNKCAIGVLIPDELYDEEWDGGRGANLREIQLEEWKNLDWALLKEMQECHDYDFLNMEPRLRRIAEDYELSIPGEEK